MGKKQTLKDSHIVLILLVSLVIPSALAASLTFQLIYQKNGSSGAQLGYSVSNAGDVDRDGTADFIVGAPYDSIGGSVFIYSGVSGNLLYKRSGASTDDEFGYVVSGIGDANGDGKADFIVGAPRADPGGLHSAGSAYVYSGATGNLIYQKDGVDSLIYFGWSVSGAGDINGDGNADFMIGAPLIDSGSLFLAGAVYIYSGANGDILFEKYGYQVRQWFGYSVASAGDVNGDGTTDFIVGAPEATPGGIPGAGSVFVYSGATGTVLYRKDGIENSAQFGTAVANAGDVNGDGTPDIIVGVPQEYSNGMTVAGAAYLFSGTNGTLLYQKKGGAPGDRLGFSVAGAGDVDGDGKSDFLIGAPTASPNSLGKAGSAYLFSGATGDTLFQQNGTFSGNQVGFSVAGIDDINTDAKTDFIIGCPGIDPPGPISAGTAYVYGLVSTDAPEKKSNRPGRFELSQNYPNPFNPTTTIRYFLSKREKVTLEIFNLLGERVRMLLEEEQTAGEHTALWDGKNENGKILSSGIYFYRLKGRAFSEIKKMIFLK